MNNLIKALQIFAKYGNVDYPTHCEHDKLTVCYSPEDFSEEDIAALDELGFHSDGESFYSYRFGSA